MTKAQIDFLLDSGYTMDEIMTRFAPAPDPAQAPAPAPDPAPAPAPKPAPAPEPDPAPAPEPQPAHTPDPFPASMAAIENTMNEIAAMLRTGALAAQFGPPTPERGVNDILAEVVNPPRRSTKK